MAHAPRGTGHGAATCRGETPCQRGCHAPPGRQDGLQTPSFPSQVFPKMENAGYKLTLPARTPTREMPFAPCLRYLDFCKALGHNSLGIYCGLFSKRIARNKQEWIETCCFQGPPDMTKS